MLGRVRDPPTTSKRTPDLVAQILLLVQHFGFTNTSCGFLIGFTIERYVDIGESLLTKTWTIVQVVEKALQI